MERYTPASYRRLMNAIWIAMMAAMPVYILLAWLRSKPANASADSPVLLIMGGTLSFYGAGTIAGAYIWFRRRLRAAASLVESGRAVNLPMEEKQKILLSLHQVNIVGMVVIEALPIYGLIVTTLGLPAIVAWITGAAGLAGLMLWRLGPIAESFQIIDKLFGNSA